MVPEKSSGHKKTQFHVIAPKNVNDDLCFSLNEGIKMHHLFISTNKTQVQYNKHTLLWGSQ